MPAKAPPKLSLHIEGNRITHDRFLRAVESFFGLLSKLSAEMAGKGRTIDWVVSVKGGSIDLGAAAVKRKPTAPAAKVVDQAYKGWKQLQSKRVRARPRHFTDEALQDVRDMAKLVDGYSVTGITIRMRQQRFKIAQEQTVSNVDALLGGTITEVGTIEGRLEMISSRGSLHFGVWDLLENRRVRCFVKPQLMDEVKAAFDKRVAVTGTIREKPTGEPVSIEVEEIEIFPDEALPTADDVYGILATLP